VFELPQIRDRQKFEFLKEQRLIYRLALGQPNQEDLIEFLARGGSELVALLRPLALNFSAFARNAKKHATGVSILLSGQDATQNETDGQPKTSDPNSSRGFATIDRCSHENRAEAGTPVPKTTRVAIDDRSAGRNGS
jgi:hypothetical protein